VHDAGEAQILDQAEGARMGLVLGQAERAAGDQQVVERAHPRADVWWGSEAFLTTRLADEGVLTAYQPAGAADIPAYVRLIGSLTKSGRLDRRVEGLPSDQELMRRAQEGQGLTRPELAVLLATAKLSLQQAIEEDDLPDDTVVQPDLFAAFPPEMRDTHRAAIRDHQLRREIIATKVANRVVNRLGIIRPLLLSEDEGFTLSDVASGVVAAEILFDLPDLWARADAAAMTEPVRILFFRRLSDATAAHVGELCRLGAGTQQPSETVATLHAGVIALLPIAEAPDAAAALAGAGVPEDLAAALARLEQLTGAAGIADLAKRRGDDAARVAEAAIALGRALGLDWAQAAAAQLDPIDPWERLLVAGVERDIQEMRLTFLARAGDVPLGNHVEQWLERHAIAVAQYRELLTRARAGSPSSPMLAEVVARARALLHRS